MKKILAVDDNSINLELLAQIIDINYPGFRFLRALNGRDAIDTVHREKPDLILLDIIMPGLSGYEVCEILKQSAETKHIPIIMVSALGKDSTERTKGLNAGADSFISKPFDQSELKAQINVALRIKEVEDLLRKRNEVLEFDIKMQTRKYLQEEERFFQISEYAREFYWEIDNSEIFTYISPVVEKTLKISPLDVIGELKFRELFQLGAALPDASKNQKGNFADFEIKLEIEEETVWLAIDGFSFVNRSGQRGKRGVCYDITRRKRAEISLKENLKRIENYQMRLKKLNSEIISVEEREKRKIAENLHDGLGQTLSLAFMNLSTVRHKDCPDDTKRIIDYTSELLNKAINESRRLTYDLSPPILYELGLVPAIQWKLEQVKKDTGIDYFIDRVEPAVQLDKEQRIILYRSICELITNISKHAKATKIVFSEKEKEGKYILKIGDNGVGFETGSEISFSNKSGFGLLSIEERIDSINGLFQIRSEIDKGTEAQIIVPLQLSENK